MDGSFYLSAKAYKNGGKEKYFFLLFQKRKADV